MSEGVELRLLGPLEVVDGDRRIDLGGTRQQIVLVTLALAANHVVSIPQLVAALWGEHPPDTARPQIHTAISALRRALPPAGWGEIRTEPAGYRLCITGDHLDLLRFDQAVADGHRLIAADRPREAVRAFRSGLALWRGPALTGLEDRLESAAARLEEARLAALETCLDHELATGGGPQTLTDLQETHARYPLREGITATLMLALFRAGRQNEALDAYRRTRTILADELGVDPSPLLAHRFVDILQGPAEPGGQRAAEAAVPRQLPAGSAGFAGRTGWLQRLDRLLPSDRAGVMPIAVISGAGGIGKTTLAVHWAHRVQADFPDGQLYANLHGFDHLASTTPLEVLHDFLIALGTPPEGIPDGLPGRVSLYRTLLAERRILVVLDNARDAEQVRPLLPGSPGCLVVVTSRNQLLGLVTAEGAQPMGLESLSTAEARELLTRRLGEQRVTDRPAAVTQIIDSCAGLPLALAVVAARLAANPYLTLPAVAAELTHAGPRLDPFTGDDQTTDVRAVFSWSYRILDDEAARLFRLAGASRIGPDMPVDAAAALGGLSTGSTRALLAQLARVHLLHQHAPGRYSFHDLVGAYAAELAQETDTEADRNAALGRLLDHYLGTAYAAGRALQYEMISMPGPETATFAEPESALTWLVAERAALIAAVDRARDNGFGTHCWRLANVIGNFLSGRCDWQNFLHTQRTALAEAERAADQLAQVEVHRYLAYVRTVFGELDSAEDHLRRALELSRSLGNPTREALCRYNLGIVYHMQGQSEQALEQAGRALGFFRQAGDERRQSLLLSAMGTILTSAGDYRLALEYGREALDLQHRTGFWRHQAGSYETIGHALLRLGEFQPARDSLRQGVELARRAGDRRTEAISLARLGDVHEACAEPGMAREARQQAVAILETLDQRSPAANGGNDPVLPDLPSLRAKLR